jgi:hypothetical protein
MGIVNRKNKNIFIWPLALWYVVVYLIIGGGFILFCNFGFIFFTIEPIEIFPSIFMSGLWYKVILMPGLIFLDYIYIEPVLWKISFTETHIIVPRIDKLVKKKFELACYDMVSCKYVMHSYSYCFVIYCSDGKKRIIPVMNFSFKQMEKIIKLIQERGGLIDTNFDDLINPVRFGKGK